MVDSVNIRSSRPVAVLRELSAGANSRVYPAAADRGVTDTVQLSARIASSGPPQDAAKIAQLREAIANGGYRVDLAAIADGMIRFGGSES